MSSRPVSSYLSYSGGGRNKNHHNNMKHPASKEPLKSSTTEENQETDENGVVGNFLKGLHTYDHPVPGKLGKEITDEQDRITMEQYDEDTSLRGIIMRILLTPVASFFSVILYIWVATFQYIGYAVPISNADIMTDALSRILLFFLLRLGLTYIFNATSDTMSNELKQPFLVLLFSPGGMHTRMKRTLVAILISALTLSCQFGGAISAAYLMGLANNHNNGNIGMPRYAVSYGMYSQGFQMAWIIIVWIITSVAETLILYQHRGLDPDTKKTASRMTWWRCFNIRSGGEQLFLTIADTIRFAVLWYLVLGVLEFGLVWSAPIISDQNREDLPLYTTCGLIGVFFSVLYLIPYEWGNLKRFSEYYPTKSIHPLSWDASE